MLKAFKSAPAFLRLDLLKYNLQTIKSIFLSVYCDVYLHMYIV